MTFDDDLVKKVPTLGGRHLAMRFLWVIGFAMALPGGSAVVVYFAKFTSAGISSFPCGPVARRTHHRPAGAHRIC
jgi:hypothetical protein